MSRAGGSANGVVGAGSGGAGVQSLAGAAAHPPAATPVPAAANTGSATGAGGNQVVAGASVSPVTATPTPTPTALNGAAARVAGEGGGGAQALGGVAAPSMPATSASVNGANANGVGAGCGKAQVPVGAVKPSGPLPAAVENGSPSNGMGAATGGAQILAGAVRSPGPIPAAAVTVNCTTMNGITAGGAGAQLLAGVARPPAPSPASAVSAPAGALSQAPLIPRPPVPAAMVAPVRAAHPVAAPVVTQAPSSPVHTSLPVPKHTPAQTPTLSLVQAQSQLAALSPTPTVTSVAYVSNAPPPRGAPSAPGQAPALSRAVPASVATSGTGPLPSGPVAPRPASVPARQPAPQVYRPRPAMTLAAPPHAVTGSPAAHASVGPARFTGIANLRVSTSTASMSQNSSVEGDDDTPKGRGKGSGLRRGKWTPEEEAYANRLIHEFKRGLLPLTDGTTLRTFLSKLLNCDPMRISKKFVGSNCIGKQVFKRRQSEMDRLTAKDIESGRTELADLERRFLERVAQTHRCKGSGSTSPTALDGRAASAGSEAFLPGGVKEKSSPPWMQPPKNVPAVAQPAPQHEAQAPSPVTKEGPRVPVQVSRPAPPQLKSAISKSVSMEGLALLGLRLGHGDGDGSVPVLARDSSNPASSAGSGKGQLLQAVSEHGVAPVGDHDADWMRINSYESLHTLVKNGGLENFNYLGRSTSVDDFLTLVEGSADIHDGPSPEILSVSALSTVEQSASGGKRKAADELPRR